MRFDDQAEAIAGGNHDDPFSYLGPHRLADGRTIVRAFEPGARHVELIDGSGQAIAAEVVTIRDGLFEIAVHGVLSRPYRLRVFRESGQQEIADPYQFDSW